MGIPRLAGHLQAYSVTSILGRQATESQDVINTPLSPMIVDGPGLAYHTYYRLLAHKSMSLKSLDAIPSYTEIGQAFIAYLDLLEAQHCHMYVVFPFLPLTPFPLILKADPMAQLAHLLRRLSPRPQAPHSASSTGSLPERSHQDTRLIP